VNRKLIAIVGTVFISSPTPTLRVIPWSHRAAALSQSESNCLRIHPVPLPVAKCVLACSLRRRISHIDNYQQKRATCCQDSRLCEPHVNEYRISTLGNRIIYHLSQASTHRNCSCQSQDHFLYNLNKARHHNSDTRLLPQTKLRSP
jgi:hypothetical protein